MHLGGRKGPSTLHNSLKILPAIVSDYMETLFSDRAIVDDRERSYASVSVHERSWTTETDALRRQEGAIYSAQFAENTASDRQRLYGNTFQRSGDRERSYASVSVSDHGQQKLMHSGGSKGRSILHKFSKSPNKVYPRTPLLKAWLASLCADGR